MVNLKGIVESLVKNFLEAGDLAIQLREKGLVKKIKLDNTPVSNGDLEVNKFILKKILVFMSQLITQLKNHLENLFVF